MSTTENKTVGFLKQGWLHKRVDTRKHQLRRPPAWAVDSEHLQELARLGALGVRLHDEARRVWTATLADFDRFGFAVDRGHGEQVGLELRHWTVSG